MPHKHQFHTGAVKVIEVSQRSIIVERRKERLEKLRAYESRKVAAQVSLNRLAELTR